MIPAAGIGARMNSDRPKQYLDLHGKTVIEHTLARISSVRGLNGVMVGIAQDDSWWSAQALPRRIPIRTSAGGDHRIHTVLNGLMALIRELGAADCDQVMVHDAVRPCVSVGDIEQLVTVARTSDQGAILGCPVVDTLKLVSPAGQITGTGDRTGLWRALTPQLFEVGALRRGLASAIAEEFMATDECEAMERIGKRPQMVDSDPRNIKITRPNDLLLARHYLRCDDG